MPHRCHVLGIEDFSAPEINAILDRAEEHAADALQGRSPVPVLSGAMIGQLFFEPSTRTRVSFEVAAKRLGAEIVNIPAATSSVAKGETLLDTCLALESIGLDALVIRHPETGSIKSLADRLSIPLLNGGDGTGEHPTQAILDALTIRQRLGRFAGLTMTIIGDLRHSRVVRSHLLLWQKLDLKVRLVGPRPLWPEKMPEDAVLTSEMAEGIAGADMLYVIRPQLERWGELSLDKETYRRDYQVTPDWLAHAKPQAFVMDAGPTYRDLQITSALFDDDERCTARQQMRNGTFVRMACLEMVIAAARQQKASSSQAQSQGAA